MNAAIAINTRVLAGQTTGVQRYTTELLSRWRGQAECIAPQGHLRGLAGHAWEQFVLPAKLRGRFLFSPSNTGPLGTKQQVVTIHDMSVFDCPDGFNSRFAAWYRLLLPRLARRARRVITDSEFTKERILRLTKVVPSKVVVIYLGVDRRFCPEAISRIDDVVAALKLPSRRYVLAVGSLEPRKNLARLFQAWACAQARLSESVWLIVAGASGTSHVFDNNPTCQLPERIFLTGHVNDIWLPALHAGALAMVYPSLYEGFGLPPLEAMASGTPVLVGNRASLPEVVGEAGLLVDPLDVDAIAEGIVHLVQDEALRAELRRRGLCRAKQFSWDETARRTWEVLKAAAA